jgi:hypothetical protein
MKFCAVAADIPAASIQAIALPVTATRRTIGIISRLPMVFAPLPIFWFVPARRLLPPTFC